MPPTIQDVASLDKRYYVYCDRGGVVVNGRCEYGAWAGWGRWVLTGVVILGIFALILMLGCVSARRRKRSGMAPLYGTGWMGPKYGQQQGPGGPAPPPGPGGYYPPPPPPQYSAQPVPNQYTGTTFNPNDGYYGAQTQGVQPPPNAYVPPHRDAGAAAGNDYQPPAGPPPGK